MAIYSKSDIMTQTYELESAVAQTVLGTHDDNLKVLENQLAADIFVRGTAVTLTGPTHEIARARKVLDYLGARGVPMTQVMALSPFQEVAEVLADLGRDDPGLGGGTIDDAPGGRADVVLLVLGGDPLRPGAKTWASGDVKAANTVLSRARRRIYVFGDYASWSTYPYFRDIAAALRRVR